MNVSSLKGKYMLDFDKEKLMFFVKTSNFDTNLPEHILKKREIGLFLLGIRSSWRQ